MLRSPSMQKRLVAGAILAALGVSLFYSGREAFEWRKRAGHERSAFDDFADEARAAIPADARVRVTAPHGVANHKYAHLLSAQLHPRVLVSDGPADWVIELPDDEFDRSKASIRRAP